MNHQRQFLARQRRMYHMMALYHEALRAYWAAIDPDTGALTQPERAEALRAASIQLEAVLTAMQDYLKQIARTTDVTAEREHVEIYLQALQVERALIK